MQRWALLLSFAIIAISQLEAGQCNNAKLYKISDLRKACEKILRIRVIGACPFRTPKTVTDR